MPLGDHDDENSRTARKPATRLAHMGLKPDEFHGFINPPLVRASTVLFENAEAQYRGTGKYTYGLTATPTTDALNEALTELENAAGTVLFPSGLAAVTFALQFSVRPGCRILIPDTVYYPTRRFADHTLRRFGAEIVYYDPM